MAPHRAEEKAQAVRLAFAVIMPVVSKAQNRFFRWAEAHPGESGVPRKVSSEFINASPHGKGALSNLPERVKAKKPKKRKPFGSLSP